MTDKCALVSADAGLECYREPISLQFPHLRPSIAGIVSLEQEGREMLGQGEGWLKESSGTSRNSQEGALASRAATCASTSQAPQTSAALSGSSPAHQQTSVAVLPKHPPLAWRTTEKEESYMGSCPRQAMYLIWHLQHRHVTDRKSSNPSPWHIK